jgi:hypothetical protein
VPGENPTSRRRPHDPKETPHEPQARRQVPQGEDHVYSGEVLAKSRAAFLAAAFVSALRNVPDLFQTVAAFTMKVSPPLRGTVISPVLAKLVFLAMSVLLFSIKREPT